MTFIEIIERLENEIKNLENNINSLRENNKIILGQRNEYMALVEELEKEIKILKDNGALKIMNKQTIEKFLKSNKLDEKFYHQISLGTLMINANGMDFSIDIDDIKSIGLNYRCIIFETQFGRFEFLRKDNMDILKKAFGNYKEK